MDQIVNVALQILPKTNNSSEYQVIDKAIEVIQKSGLAYKVCPFETVIEGPYSEVMNVVNDAQEVCFANGAHELIANLKIHRAADRSVFINDKMEKYS